MHSLLQIYIYYRRAFQEYIDSIPCPPALYSKQMKVAEKSHFSYFVLLGYSATLGLVGGVITTAFVFIFETLQRLIWTDLPNSLSINTYHTLFQVLICGIGGLCVGLLIKKLGSYPTSIEEAVENYKKTKTFDYQHIWQAFIISIISLGFGAALGPEAALTAIVGGFVTLIGIKLRHAEILAYGAEIQKKLPKIKRTVLGLLAAVVGLGFFRSFGTGDYFNLHLQPYTFHISDIVWAILITLAGTAMGYLYVFADNHVERMAKNLRKDKTVLLAMVGGIGLGLLASFQPLALFSGHEGIVTLMQQWPEHNTVYLAAAALIKIVAAVLCLATGWKGGRFFPVMFVGSAIGLACAASLSSISPTLGLCVGMSATLAYVLKRPVITIVLLAFFFPPNLYVFIIFSAYAAAIASKKLLPQN